MMIINMAVYIDIHVYKHGRKTDTYVPGLELHSCVYSILDMKTVHF